ncbi:heat shock transcription factor, Y-linked-like [Hydra vulgaris]|uniref:Heat shock transcription factor, Y-linked-like n=1 Tax=Hydra vulgaris TaxID=6087 RepID=A0ABM4BU47_HYDVU
MEFCDKADNEIEGVSQLYAGKSFPKRLWLLLSKSLEFNSVIHWSEDGHYIVIPVESYFEQKILHRRKGKIFKTESMKSFVRQLNLYGFHKVQSEKDEEFLSLLRYIDRNQWPQAVFKHPYFIKERDDLLENVKRRCNIKRKIKNVLQNSVAFDDQNNSFQYPVYSNQNMAFITSNNYSLSNSGKEATKPFYHFEWRASYPYGPVQYFIYPQECLAYNTVLSPINRLETETSASQEAIPQEYNFQSSSVHTNNENAPLDTNEISVSYYDSFCSLAKDI